MTAPSNVEETSRVRRSVSGRLWRVWVLSAALAIGGAFGIAALWDWQPAHPDIRAPWWALALLFYLAEMAVLHLRFRKDAYSFSMSEIPLVIGLAFAAPVALVAAQVVGNALVLAVHRRQPPIKYAFNLAQFGVQSLVAVAVHRAILGVAEPLGPVGWAASVAGALAALVTADVLINVVIRLSGGRLSVTEVAAVFALSAAATVMNTSLGLVAGIVIEARPEGTLLGLAPAAILFLAYRAYVSQREEGMRLESLYDATRALHASPQIEGSLAAATAQARAIFEAEFSEIVLFPTGEDAEAYRTMAGPGERVQVMQPASPEATDSIRSILTLAQRGVVRSADPHPIGLSELLEIKDAIATPLVGSKGPVGVILVANRLGDISTFDIGDVRMLETIASQVGVSLENGRLEDSLAELTALKERLEGLVKSKDEFVASVSHELRTPLTAVVGLAAELRANRDAFSDGELDEFMGVIAEQSGELSDIVEDLLVAARADIGTLVLREDPVDLGTIVTALLANNTGLSEIVAEVRGGCRPVMADPLRVRQVIRNLITNAERYGGEKVWIELRDLPDGSGAVVDVVDDGTGVPADAELSIFDAYERAHNAVGQPGSVGLGLAVSRQLARLMGGDLRYRREFGLTAFEFVLRAAPRD